MRKYPLIITLFSILFLSIGSAAACGGLFCQNIPISQQAERIIFTVNDDDTVSAYVQINYTGAAPDFSWVVPVPSIPEVDVAEMATFNELDSLTTPVFLPPQVPQCAPIPPMPVLGNAAVMEDSADDGVIVLASGTAGPYGFDVVDSDDPDALILWLRENNYQVTQDMEPLIHVYNEEGMIFLAMKLQPEQGVQDIQPIVMTYESQNPMIPIRLTAVAAQPNMNILTWVFADEQAIPENYTHLSIEDTELRGDFTTFNSTNYMQLLDSKIDEHEGLAFITEYAQPTSELMTMQPQDPLLQELTQEYRYVTRFLGRMSPEEMTLDPVLILDGQRENVSNIHDLTKLNAEIFWNCPNAEQSSLPVGGSIALIVAIGLGTSVFGLRRRSKAKRG